ncbi:MAG: SPASM domain-containing protein [Candidatus Brocadiia bacterium]
MYKLSRFTLFYENYPEPGEYLVYNTRTQAVMAINRQVKDFIDRTVSTNTRRILVSGLSDEEGECVNLLKESGIILDYRVDETRLLEEWFSEMKTRTKPLSATILTTYKCNFACFYCFEERVKQAKSLDGETMQGVIDWIKNKAIEKRVRDVRLMFYGGEPLMNPKAILHIAGVLNAWAREQCLRFSFGMITNGSLIDKDLIERLTGYGLTSLRVTLDGDREHHDRRRPFINGRGSFDSIVAKIDSIIDKVGVEIGGNFDRDNLDSFRKLLDFMDAKGWAGKIQRVLFAPVVARMGDNNDANLSVEMVGCHSLSSDLSEEALKLQKETIARGYKVDSAAVVTTCPMTQDDSTVVIDPHGDIYKCEGFVGRPQFSIGNVRQAKPNQRLEEFNELKPWKSCSECVYMPMCGGGCRLMAQLKHSDYSKPACEIDYYKRIFPQLLKMDYERGAL